MRLLALRSRENLQAKVHTMFPRKAEALYGVLGSQENGFEKARKHRVRKVREPRPVWKKKENRIWGALKNWPGSIQNNLRSREPRGYFKGARSEWPRPYAEPQKGCCLYNFARKTQCHTIDSSLIKSLDSFQESCRSWDLWLFCYEGSNTNHLGGAG